jgi:predicted O-methyltransferase YrrM
LLGCYEFEVHPAIETATWRRPQIIINVGCAEGFYAIGLARLMREARVIAIDILPSALALCEEYARRNEVRDRIELVHGAEKPESLCFACAGHRLYVIDCEGAEFELVDPVRCPDLINSDLIIECHDFLRPGVSAQLAERLAATHRVDRIVPRLPDLDQFQFMRQFPTIMAVMMAVEKRPMPCCWLACWANTKGKGNG